MDLEEEECYFVFHSRSGRPPASLRLLPHVSVVSRQREKVFGVCTVCILASSMHNSTTRVEYYY